MAALIPLTPVDFDVPPGACDCHTHIHGDPARFPFFEGRVYTPEPASPEEMAALHAALRMRRVVIVTPSVYGTDNRASLFGIQARGADARGVAVIDDATSDEELDALDRTGFRGLRLNLATVGIDDPALARSRFRCAVERAVPLGWHVQIYTLPSLIAAMREDFEASPVPVVFDHFGGIRAEHGLDQRGFPELVALVRAGHAYVKISGAYRASDLAPEYPDVAPFARALIEANPDRVVWGTDWPHPRGTTPPGGDPLQVTPGFRIDDGRLLNQLLLWAPDPAVRARILVDNPARLYGF